MGMLLNPKTVPNVQSFTKKPAPKPVVAEPTEPEPTDAEIQAEAREQSLLRRNRGRFGTIATGFTGFLNASENSGRKTLLGE